MVLTANYNRNATTNVDTARYEYNWLGEKHPLNSPGEQSRQYSRADNDNWNGTLTLNYRIARVHMLTFNHVLSTFQRDNTSLLAVEEQTDAIAKQTRKNISGLSYRLMPSEKWNFSAFGKYYRQYVAGPMAEDDTGSNYVRTSRTVDSWGYGAAGTYFILPGLQAKLSYEKAYRLPTIEEMFGDEDLESGDIGIRPEKSDNINLNLSYSRSFGKTFCLRGRRCGIPQYEGLYPAQYPGLERRKRRGHLYQLRQGADEGIQCIGTLWLRTLAECGRQLHADECA